MPPAARGIEPDGAAGRFGPTHALILLIAFLGLGCGLFLAGTELDTVLVLLGGCGAIGAATLTAAGGGPPPDDGPRRDRRALRRGQVGGRPCPVLLTTAHRSAPSPTSPST